MTNYRKKLLLKICDGLDVSASYFINPQTSILHYSFKILCTLRMSEIGIYSYAELGRVIGLPEPGRMSDIIAKFDLIAKQEHIEINPDKER